MSRPRSPIPVAEVIGAILREHEVLGVSERDRVEAAVRSEIPAALQQEVTISVAPGREVVISASRLVALRIEALVPAIRRAAAEASEGPEPQVRLRRL
jgi:hypothetical protein